MRADIPAPLDPSLLNRQSVTVTLYLTGGPYDLIAGTAGLTTLDLTPFASSVTQTDSGATVPCAYLNELTGANAPVPGLCVQIRVGGYVAFNGIIDSVSDITESRGKRGLTINLKRRDAMSWWRDLKRVGSLFTVGVDLGAILADVAGLLNLQAAENLLGNTGIILAHDQVQLVGLSAWDMLTKVLQPGLQEPYVDALGRLKAISRNVQQPASQTLSYARVKTMTGGSARNPITNLIVHWLSPNLQQVIQLDQVIGQCTLTSGFFLPMCSQDVYFSSDRTQRAMNTYYLAKQSVNAGLIPVGFESWTQDDAFHGHMSIVTKGFIQGLAAAALGALIALSAVPEPVVTAGVVASSGTTVPAAGRVPQQAAQNVLLFAVMTMGTGVYEIHGQPYDMLNVDNQSEAYDSNAPAWLYKLQEISNDLVPNEATADSLAVNELLYGARAAANGQLVMADDLRVERGDILGTPDGRNFYCTGYSRNLSRGAEPVLTLSGFFV